jgi:serine/threonine-protein kinase
LVWVDRHGGEQTIAAPPRAYRYPRLSPDGTKIAMDIDDEERDIWTWDLARGQLMRLTFGPALDYYPVWTPDGRSLLYSEGWAAPGGIAGDIFRKAADNTGSVERLTHSATIKFASALSPDGHWLVYREDILGDTNLFLVALDGTGQPQPLFPSKFAEANAEISADGRWIAYQSDESGKDEVYVRPFPAVESSRWQISSGGGTHPMWSRNGREILFAGPGGVMLVVVAVAPTPPGSPFSFGGPQPLFALAPYYRSVGRTIDISPDGQHFLAIKQQEARKQQDTLVVVSHWFDELKARVPIK